MLTVAARPVQTLREHTRALEAALSVALANPRKSIVHKLRSQTRRIEAQLLLLDQLKGLPPHRREEATLRRELKRLRQAAGHVRDLDVHTDHLRRQHHQHNLDELLDDLAHRRECAAADLTHLISKRQARLSAALEALHTALKPADTLALPVAELLAHARTIFDRVLPRRRDFARLREDRLHDLRKAAKLARYIAESAPRSRHALATAEHYEALQAAGGHWHDALTLTELARHDLGRKHALTAHLRTLRERHHTAFLAALGRACGPADL